MKLSLGRAAAPAALALMTLLACDASRDPVELRLHAAQRAYWQARQAQERLDIYPSLTLAEECRNRYLAIADENPPLDLPATIDDPEAPAVKLARVGAMAVLGAASLHRELGESGTAIGMLRGALRDDLPLGALVERKLRATLASFLKEDGRLEEAIGVHRDLLAALGPGLAEGDAAYPDAELLALPAKMVELAEAVADRDQLEATGDFLAGFFARLDRDYPGTDADYQGLLNWADLAMHMERWGEADAALGALAERFPDRDPWRAELRRARLLSSRLGRPEEAEAILARWAGADDPDAAVAAGKEWIRYLLLRGRFDEVEDELRSLKRKVRHREDRAELLYLWGEYESRGEAWEEARQRWGEAAAGMPYTPYGMRSQLAVAFIWTERAAPRFAARALERLFRACRRNARLDPGSELAGLSLTLETRADSLLGTLPASEEAVRDLLLRRQRSRTEP